VWLAKKTNPFCFKRIKHKNARGVESLYLNTCGIQSTSVSGFRSSQNDRMSLRSSASLPTLSHNRSKLNDFIPMTSIIVIYFLGSALLLIQTDSEYVCKTSRLASSTLKREVICSYETSVDFHRITYCYIPEDRTL
jgi:hypothetical protein